MRPRFKLPERTIIATLGTLASKMQTRGATDASIPNSRDPRQEAQVIEPEHHFSGQTVTALSIGAGIRET